MTGPESIFRNDGQRAKFQINTVSRHLSKASERYDPDNRQVNHDATSKYPAHGSFDIKRHTGRKWAAPKAATDRNYNPSFSQIDPHVPGPKLKPERTRSTTHLDLDYTPSYRLVEGRPIERDFQKGPERPSMQYPSVDRIYDANHDAVRPRVHQAPGFAHQTGRDVLHRTSTMDVVYDTHLSAVPAPPAFGVGSNPRSSSVGDLVGEMDFLIADTKKAARRVDRIMEEYATLKHTKPGLAAGYRRPKQ
eukprot:gnl/Trimastix_PCT/1781.p1 GENE.gnl/Trimastix_PCT/1781~~gnl/Trimastix_PCT/1781.p1  ORF type:complete len:277 (-),score=9.83 gnl/Trimastix_PCT/1781:195-938(-)